MRLIETTYPRPKAINACDDDIGRHGVRFTGHEDLHAWSARDDGARWSCGTVGHRFEGIPNGLHMNVVVVEGDDTQADEDMALWDISEKGTGYYQRRTTYVAISTFNGRDLYVDGDAEEAIGVVRRRHGGVEWGGGIECSGCCKQRVIARKGSFIQFTYIACSDLRAFVMTTGGINECVGTESRHDVA